MFKLAVQTGGLEEPYGIDGAYRLIAETGFEGADANIDHLMTPSRLRAKEEIPPLLRKGADEREMLELFRPWKEGAEKYGVENYQAHAPFPSILPPEGPADGAYNEAILELLRRTIIGSAYVGARNLVIHPFFFPYDYMGTWEEEWEMNKNGYLSLAQTAAENGVTICLENMFRAYKNKRIGATCSNAPDAIAYIDRLNDLAGQKVFGFCLDTGHAFLSSQDVRDFMVRLGDRISCFHVHDNDGVGDLHLAPYSGGQDWDRFADGLARINFRKTLSFETFRACSTTAPELVPEVLKLIEQSGRLFDRKAEEYRRAYV